MCPWGGSVRKPWSTADLALLREHYADSRTDDLALVLSRTLTTVYQKAIALGLRKSADYLASENSGRVLRGQQNEAMRATQFKPGQPSWSNGMKGIVGVQEACRATQFKKGRPAHEAHNYLPIGSERICKDGLLERKVTDDPTVVPARRWVAVHRIVWEQASGPIPDGCSVVFRPGRRSTELAAITADALECVTRAELMRRNSYHTNYPPEVARLIQLRGAINRQINKRAQA